MRARVLSQKFINNVSAIRASLSQPRKGRNNLAQGESPGENGPHPLWFPLPRPAGEGEGGEGHSEPHGLRRGLNSVARRLTG